MNSTITINRYDNELLAIALNFMVDNYQSWTREDKKLRETVAKHIRTLRDRSRLLEKRYDILSYVFDHNSFVEILRRKMESLSGKSRGQKIAIVTQIYDLLLTEYANWSRLADQKFKNTVSNKLVELRTENEGFLEGQQYDILLTDEDKVVLQEINNGKRLRSYLCCLFNGDEISKISKEDIQIFFRLANKILKKKK